MLFEDLLISVRWCIFGPVNVFNDALVCAIIPCENMESVGTSSLSFKLGYAK